MVRIRLGGKEEAEGAERCVYACVRVSCACARSHRTRPVYYDAQLKHQTIEEEGVSGLLVFGYSELAMHSMFTLSQETPPVQKHGLLPH